jgi:hypothetical protein
MLLFFAFPNQARRQHNGFDVGIRIARGDVCRRDDPAACPDNDHRFRVGLAELAGELVEISGMINTRPETAKQSLRTSPVKRGIGNGGNIAGPCEGISRTNEEIVFQPFDFTLARDDEFSAAARQQDQIGARLDRITAHQTAQLQTALRGNGENTLGCIRKPRLCVIQ